MTAFSERLGNEATIGTFLKLPIVESVEMMAVAGMDLIVIDLEHSSMSLESASHILAVAKALQLGTLVRIPSHGYEWIQRSLDAGANGVLIPHVDTKEQASAAVAAAHFPPEGTRGFSPTTRAGEWSIGGGDLYRRSENDVAVVVQIESSAGVDNVKSIIEAGVDSVFVGPADLSVAMGVAVDSRELEDARSLVLSSAREQGVPCGIAAGNGTLARELIADGFSYAVVGNDATMLGERAERLVEEFRN